MEIPSAATSINMLKKPYSEATLGYLCKYRIDRLELLGIDPLCYLGDLRELERSIDEMVWPSPFGSPGNPNPQVFPWHVARPPVIVDTWVGPANLCWSDLCRLEDWILRDLNPADVVVLGVTWCSTSFTYEARTGGPYLEPVIPDDVRELNAVPYGFEVADGSFWTHMKSSHHTGILQSFLKRFDQSPINENGLFQRFEDANRYRNYANRVDGFHNNNPLHVYGVYELPSPTRCDTMG
ncbi:MAG: hypothetical protein ABJA67_14450 [Chthonomonadales bacterium]